MRRYLAGPRGKPAAVHSSAAIQRQSLTLSSEFIPAKKKNEERGARALAADTGASARSSAPHGAGPKHVIIARVAGGGRGGAVRPPACAAA